MAGKKTSTTVPTQLWLLIGPHRVPLRHSESLAIRVKRGESLQKSRLAPRQDALGACYFYASMML